MSQQPVKLTVEGDQNLRRTMAAAESSLEDFDQSENARLVQQRAQAAAPKVSGTLRGSIRAKDLGKGTAVVGSDLVYAPVINYGWPARHIAAQPFLTRALVDSTTIVQANSLRETNQILAKVKGA